jgi:hypothetical protein
MCKHKLLCNTNWHMKAMKFCKVISHVAGGFVIKYLLVTFIIRTNISVWNTKILFLCNMADSYCSYDAVRALDNREQNDNISNSAV